MDGKRACDVTSSSVLASKRSRISRTTATTTAAAATAIEGLVSNEGDEFPYNSLPSRLSKELTPLRDGMTARNQVMSIASELLQHGGINSGNVMSIVEAKLSNKSLRLTGRESILGGGAGAAGAASTNTTVVDTSHQRIGRASKPMSSRERKASGLYNIPDAIAKFHLYLPLHQLWSEYMSELIGTSTVHVHSGELLGAKLVRADMHGAFVTVVRSSSPSLVGQKGIILQELTNCIKMITEDDHLLMIPKRCCVFGLRVGSFFVELYGSQLCFRASERSVRKFKSSDIVNW